MTKELEDVAFDVFYAFAEAFGENGVSGNFGIASPTRTVVDSKVVFVSDAEDYLVNAQGDDENLVIDLATTENKGTVATWMVLDFKGEKTVKGQGVHPISRQNAEGDIKKMVDDIFEKTGTQFFTES